MVPIPPIPPMAFNISKGLLIVCLQSVYTVFMFNVVFIVFACKNKDAAEDSVWKTCSTQSDSWSGAPNSEFGFRLQAAEEQVWITAPQDCDTPVYTLDQNGITPQSWSLETCTDRIGQEISLYKDDVWLYSPIQQ